MSLLSPTLEAFSAVAKNGTVHGAARELGLTQTGVTQRLRALESSLSTTLFTRSRRGMKLTAEGESLLRYCQSTKDLEGEVLARIQSPGKLTEARCRLTGSTSLLESRVVSQLAPLLKTYPQLVMTLNANDLESRIDDLRAGRAEFAIVPRKLVAKEMDSKLLRPERYVLAGTKRWKGRHIKEVIKSERIIDFDPTDRTTHEYLEKYGWLDQVQKERHFVNNNSALVRLLKEGLGYGTLLEEIASSYFQTGELIPLHPSGGLKSDCALAWYPRPQMAPYFKALIQAIH